MHNGYLRNSEGRHLRHVVEDPAKMLLVWEHLRLVQLEVHERAWEYVRLPGEATPHLPTPL